MRRTWKSQLNDAWMTGNYVGFVGSHLLQQVRNQFGPEWLVKFNLKKALAAQDDDESENDGPMRSLSWMPRLTPKPQPQNSEIPI